VTPIQQLAIATLLVLVVIFAVIFMALIVAGVE
jgi:hypothetical protein